MSIPCEGHVITEAKLCDEGERDEYLELKVSDGWSFFGVKTRNTFVEYVDGKDRKLSYLLQPGAITRWWGGFGRPVHQIEVLVKNKDEHPRELSDDSLYGDWVVVWEDCNDFRTLAESEQDAADYTAFIQTEADIIARRIDGEDDLTPQWVHEHMSDQHSGNTAAWAWGLGCKQAKDQERAESFRQFWNEMWGVEDRPGEVVNPAVMKVKA